MKEYKKPTAELHNISAEDVITASVVSNSAGSLLKEMGLSEDNITFVDW